MFVISVKVHSDYFDNVLSEWFYLYSMLNIVFMIFARTEVFIKSSAVEWLHADNEAEDKPLLLA